MPNHFHLLVRQNGDIPTWKLMGKVCTSYSMYFNNKYERVGHVFQDQFKQREVLNNDYLRWLSAYIHLNPVEAGISVTAAQYPYSSAGRFIKGLPDGLTDSEIVTDQFEGGTYETFLATAREAQEYRDTRSESEM
jgi:hypothetical protein